MKCTVIQKDRPCRGAGDADPVDFTFHYDYCCEKAKLLTTQGLSDELHFFPGVMGGGPYVARLNGNFYHGDGSIPLACPYCGAEINQITLYKKIDGTLRGYMDHKSGKYYDRGAEVRIKTYD